MKELYEVFNLQEDLFRLTKERTRGVYTFSLRIYKKDLVIDPSNDTYCSKEVYRLFNNLILNNISILISGKTGSGKIDFYRKCLYL